MTTITGGKLCKIKPFSYFHCLCMNISRKVPRLLEITQRQSMTHTISRDQEVKISVLKQPVGRSFVH